jgi:hypothetical protein
MIDRHKLLATLKPLVTELEDSIRERALSTPEIASHVELEHRRAVSAERTAMSLEEWRDGEITQAAVAWILGCVFIRFLEDNGLIDEALISGPGRRRAAALGHREEYFRANPEHSDREYLEGCFRTVVEFPPVAPLYDERHNPLWRLAPTADGARALRETFTAIEPGTGQLVHDFTDSELGTRFLGDLYQDLSETAKKRYALLQTPDFVERFILDRTLTPAIEEFGIDEVHIIDPTCGSGHFLIGAFQRLFALRAEREPGTTKTVLAQQVLDHIAGVDLNPYATAIARFRLVIAALRACGISRLAEAPAFKLHIATGDSLLHGPLPADGAPMLFDANRLSTNISHVYESEDAVELKAILGRGYHAVVGNPPYIAGDDEAARTAYRRRYTSCHREFTLTVPFMERFFELGAVRDSSDRKLAGYVGKITGNGWLKREFGSALVDRFLPTADVTTLIDASGAYIPGHGTPTVLVFGRARRPLSSEMRVVDGIRGEPGTPADPANGRVWSEIVRVIDDPGSSSVYVRSSDVARNALLSHPVVLGIGRDLKWSIEAGRRTVGDVAESLGRMAASSADDIFERRAHAWYEARDEVVPCFEGGSIRDWGLATRSSCFFPYSAGGLKDLPPAVCRRLWPYRTTLWSRRTFNKVTYREEGKSWWSWHQVSSERLSPRLRLTWAFISTHNHFILDRGGGVYKQSAPLIQLPDGTSLSSTYRLLGLLNSSVACFWLKQVCQDKGVGGIGGGIGDEAWEPRYEMSANRVAELPLASQISERLPELLDGLARERSGLLALSRDEINGNLAAHLRHLEDRDREIAGRMIALQEELDWQILAAYHLLPTDPGLVGDDGPDLVVGQRAFEIVLARHVASGTAETTWFERHAGMPITDMPSSWPDDYREVVRRRIELIESDPTISLIESPEHKRRWNVTPWEDRRTAALMDLVLAALEEEHIWTELRLRSTAELTDVVRTNPIVVEALELLADRKDIDIATTVHRLVVESAVPQLTAHRFTEEGLRKRAKWSEVWALQQAEDRGESPGPIPAPPKYSHSDFRSGVSWRQRGKFDVPQERFVLVSRAEKGADASPVVGWAGWDERDLARALAARTMELREQEAADAGRVTPLLAGVLELLPKIRQWYPDSDPLYSGPPGQYFEGWLDGQLAELATTRVNLCAWRPPAPTRGRKAKAGAA